MNRKSSQVSLEPYGYRVVLPATPPLGQPKRGKSSGGMKALITITLSIIGLWFIVIYLAPKGLPNDLHAPTPTYAAAPAYQAQAQTHEVVYQIITTTCINFDVTYEMSSGTSQKSVRACPGQGVVDRLTATHGQFVYLSAQNTTDVPTPQSFSCYISVDGEEVASVQSSGFSSIASCDSRIE